MLQTPSIWSWHNQFGPDDGSGMAVSTTQCAFVAGQRDAEQLVVCEIRQRSR